MCLAGVLESFLKAIREKNDPEEHDPEQTQIRNCFSRL